VTERAKNLEEVALTELVGGIVHDAGTLVSQQIDLLRAEVLQELRRAGTSAVTLAAGGGLLAAAGLLSGPMLVHLLHRLTRLPLWVCYATVAGSMGAAGVALLRTGGRGLGQVQLFPPPQTAEVARENLAWLQGQVRPASSR